MAQRTFCDNCSIFSCDFDLDLATKRGVMRCIWNVLHGSRVTLPVGVKLSMQTSPTVTTLSLTFTNRTVSLLLIFLKSDSQSQELFHHRVMQTLVPQFKALFMMRAHQHGKTNPSPICAHFKTKYELAKESTSGRLFSVCWSGLFDLDTSSWQPGVYTVNESFGCSSQQMKIGWVSSFIHSLLALRQVSACFGDTLTHARQKAEK